MDNRSPSCQGVLRHGGRGVVARRWGEVAGNKVCTVELRMEVVEQKIHRHDDE